METKKYNELVEIGKRYIYQNIVRNVIRDELCHHGIKGMK